MVENTKDRGYTASEGELAWTLPYEKEGTLVEKFVICISKQGGEHLLLLHIWGSPREILSCPRVLGVRCTTSMLIRASKKKFVTGTIRIDPHSF